MSRFRFLKWASCLNLFVLLLIASSLIDNKNLTWIAIFICIFYFIFCKDNKVMNDDSALVYMSVFLFAPRISLIIVHAYMLGIYGDKDSALVIIVFVALIHYMLLSGLFDYLKISPDLEMFGLVKSNSRIAVSKMKRRFLSSWVMYYVYVIVTYIVAAFIRRFIVDAFDTSMKLMKMEVLPNLAKYIMIFLGIQILFRFFISLINAIRDEVKNEHRNL